MRKILNVSAAAALALAFAIPAFAGGAHCGDNASASASAADMHECSAHTSAWSGAWLQRDGSGDVTVTAVAKGSPAYRSGLKDGDIVLAVNGYDLRNAGDRQMCSSKADCSVGRSVTYKVQRGHSVKLLKFKLEKMPSNAAARYQQAAFDPSLAAVVIPAATAAN